MFEIGTANPQIRRLAITRTIYYSTEDGTNFGYWAIARGSISQDASTVIYDSNFGEPTQMRVMLVETGCLKVAASSDRATLKAAPPRLRR